LNTRLHQHCLKIFSPRFHIIPFNNLNLKYVVERYKSSHFRQRLSTRPSYSQQKSITLRLSQNSGNSTNMFTSILEKYQFHRVFTSSSCELGISIKIFLKFVHFLSHFQKIGNLHIISRFDISSVPEIYKQNSLLV